MTNKRKREIRTRKYFIDAASKIIKDSSIEDVTIRKVADEAGYNSATIYNYFDNIDALIMFALNDYLDHYIKQLISSKDDNKTNYETYKSLWMNLWECVCKYPNEYYYIFLKNHSVNISDVFNEYFENHQGVHNQVPEVIKKAILSPGTIISRDKIFLSALATNVDPEEIDTVCNVVCLTFRGMLRELQESLQDGSHTVDDYNNKFEKAFDYVTLNLKRQLDNK